ncbi:hypothetical protein Tco_0719109 [Tanacetum coccineum]
MAGLEFCPKHNMVAYLEKTDGNTEFHQIMDFLTRSSIYYALTVSPIVSTSFVEQFWTTAKSRTVNNTSYIDATVAGKPVTISEASIRSDLLFDDADGIDSLTNQAIFDNIQLMGNQLKDVPVPLDHFPVPTLTKKVLTFMVKKGKNFSGKVTPLFDSMLVQQTEDEGDASERPSDSPPIPSHPHPKGSGSGQEAKERSQTTYHTSQSLDEDTIGKEDFSEEKRGTQGVYVDDTLDYMETKDVQDEMRNEGTAEQNEGKSVTQTALTPTPTTPTLITPCYNESEQVEAQGKGKKEYRLGMLRRLRDQGLLQQDQYDLANDEEVARKVQEEWEAEEEKKMLAEEEATKRKREMYTIEQRTKFLHDTIAAQRKFLAQQRSEAIRNKPPIRNQLRNQMMTYLKHVGGKKHSELKTKTFEEIQVLYERLKRQDQNFVAIGSAKDERQIKEMNEESKDPEKKRLKKRVVNEEDTAKVPAKQEATEQGTKKRKSGHVKMIARKRPRPQPDDDSDDEHRKCLRIVTFEKLETLRMDVIYMLVERRYPLSKELLQQMIDLGLEVEEESTTALQLVRFIKQQLMR